MKNFFFSFFFFIPNYTFHHGEKPEQVISKSRTQFLKITLFLYLYSLIAFSGFIFLLILPAGSIITRPVKAVVSFLENGELIKITTDKQGSFSYEFKDKIFSQLELDITYKDKSIKTKANVLELLKDFPEFEKMSWFFFNCFDTRGGLEKYAEQNIQDLEEAGGGDNVGIIVFYLSSSGWIDIAYIRNKEEVPLFIDRGIIAGKVVIDEDNNLMLEQPLKYSLLLKHTDINNAEFYSVVSDFLKLNTEHFSSKNYLLSISSHGAGDDSFFINLKEIKELLDEHKGKINILAFDACFMGSCEVLYQFRNSVTGDDTVIIASPGEVPAFGWPYARIIKALRKGPGISSNELAELIINQYISFYEEIGFANETISAFDMKKIISCVEEGNISPGMNKLCR